MTDTRGVAYPDGSCSHGYSDWRYACSHYHVSQAGQSVPRPSSEEALARRFPRDEKP